MSNFNFASNAPAVMYVNLLVNLAKNTDPRDTVVGKCHNGSIKCSPKNDGAWMEVRAYTQSQGWLPLELDYKGTIKKVDSEKFWMKLFKCTDVEEVPDVAIKIQLGSIDEAEGIFSQGGCLAIKAEASNLTILGEQEYKGVETLYLRLAHSSLSLLPYYGINIDGNWVAQCLHESSVEDTDNGSGDSLSKYRRTAKKQQKREEMIAARNNLETSSTEANTPSLMEL